MQERSNRINNFYRYLTIFAGILALRIVIGIGAESFFGRDSALGGSLVMIIIWLTAWNIFTKHLRNEGLLAQLIGYLIVSVALDALAAAFPPLMILVVIWVIYNLKKALDSILQLVPFALCSLVLYASLLPAAIVHGDVRILMAYIGFSVVYSIYASRLPLQDGLFRMATMLLSLPMIALLASSIHAGLRNLFQQTVTSSTRAFKVPQNVRAHVRAGIDVNAYTRNVTKPITDISIATHASSANISMATAVVSRKAADQATAPVDDAHA